MPVDVREVYQQAFEAQAEAPVCHVRWASFDDGVESVLITGYHDDVVICKVIDSAKLKSLMA